MANLQSFLQIKDAMKHFEYSYKEYGAVADYVLNGEERTYTATPEALAAELKRQGFIEDYSADLMVQFRDADNERLYSIGIEIFMKECFEESDWKSLIASQIVEHPRRMQNAEKIRDAVDLSRNSRKGIRTKLIDLMSAIFI